MSVCISLIITAITLIMFVIFHFSQMFVITGFMNIINKAMTDQFPRSIAHLSEGAVSVKRIQVCFSEYSMHVAVSVLCFQEICVKSDTMWGWSYRISILCSPSSPLSSWYRTSYFWFADCVMLVVWHDFEMVEPGRSDTERHTCYCCFFYINPMKNSDRSVHHPP